jgi:micrococcal nuclease
MFEYAAQILKVVDGDTCHAEVDFGCDLFRRMVLRFHGINAPELSTPAGKDAKAFLVPLIEGKAVILRTIKDHQEKYGRYLSRTFPAWRSDEHQRPTRHFRSCRPLRGLRRRPPNTKEIPREHPQLLRLRRRPHRVCTGGGRPRARGHLPQAAGVSRSHQRRPPLKLFPGCSHHALSVVVASREIPCDSPAGVRSTLRSPAFRLQ